VQQASTSVIIPVRNGAGFIGEAMASALAQLDPGDEMIVVDDGSTDQTRAVVASIGDPRITLVESGGRGVSAARNVGISIATRDYIAFLDHDDAWPAERHAVMSGILRDRPEIDAVFGRMRVKFEQGSQLNERMAAMDGRHVGVASVGTGLFRKRIVDRVTGFDEDLHFGEDVDFYLRLVESGMQIETCETDGLLYRRHASNCSNDLHAMERGMNDVLLRRIKRMRKRNAGGGTA
jgi:glycosyltransferase involved in cell wall biosynthesis